MFFPFTNYTTATITNNGSFVTPAKVMVSFESLQTTYAPLEGSGVSSIYIAHNPLGPTITVDGKILLFSQSFSTDAFSGRVSTIESSSHVVQQGVTIQGEKQGSGTFQVRVHMFHLP